MWQIFSAVLAWLFRTSVIKFTVITVVYVIVTVLISLVWSLVSPFASTSTMGEALGGVPSGVWWLLYLFRADLGLKLTFGAAVTRFIIRRIPFVN